MSFVILVDTREQLPVLWDRVGDVDFPGIQIEFKGLVAGDYSVKNMHTPDCEHSITIERKSLADLFQTLGRGRERFEREALRMSEFDHAELVIESDLASIFNAPPALSQMNPKAVYRSLVAISQRYNIKIWPCYNRSFLEKHIFVTLQRFWLDRQPGGKAVKK